MSELEQSSLSILIDVEKKGINPLEKRRGRERESGKKERTANIRLFPSVLSSKWNCRRKRRKKVERERRNENGQRITTTTTH